MAELPFELVNNADVMKAPKRKLPYIDDGGTLCRTRALSSTT